MPSADSAQKIPRVLCLGEVLEDCIIQNNQRHCYLGGAPANVAAGLVKLGTPAGFIGAIGCDLVGDGIMAQLAGLGLNVQGVQRIENLPTRQVLVQHQANGERQFVGFAPATISTFADEMLQATALPTDLLGAAEFLVLGTLGFAAAETGKALYRALDLAQEFDLKILMDVNWRPIFWKNPEQAKPRILELLPQAHLIKLAAEEADWLFQTRNPQAIKQKLGENLALVVVTDGERGCQYATADVYDSLPAFSVKVADTTGAGDGFVAGLLHRLGQDGEAVLRDGARLREIFRFASAVGAIVAQAPGAIAPQPTAASVDLFLQAWS